MSFWFWTRIQNIRRELRNGKNNSIFPIADKTNNDLCDKNGSSNGSSGSREGSGNRGDSDDFVTPKSVSPSSLLTKSFTSADFVAKSLLDKKVFAASGQVCKSPSSGLKDLI